MRTLALATNAGFIGFTIAVYLTGNATWVTAACFAVNALSMAVWIGLLSSPSHTEAGGG